MDNYEVIKDLEVSDEASPLFGTHSAGSVLEIAAADAEAILEFVENGFLKLVGGADEKTEEETAPPAPPEEAPVVPPAPVEEEVAPPAPPAVEVPAHPEATTHPEWESLADKFPAAPSPFEKVPGFLYAVCLAIKAHEAYFAPGEDSRYPSGTRSFHDKNPGNLKFASQVKAIGEDKDSFAVFETEEDGFQALINQIEAAVKGGAHYKALVWDPTIKSDRPQNILDFFKIYAPAPVPNPLKLATPEEYAAEVCAYCAKVAGVETIPATTPMAALLA